MSSPIAPSPASSGDLSRDIPGRISLPRAPEIPPRVRLPVITVLAPIVASAALWAMTRSAMALVFAALGPIIAIATTADSLIQRRRARTREGRRFRADCESTREEIDAALEHTRLARELAHPSAAARIEHLERDPQRWTAGFDGALVLRIGTALVRSGLEFDGAAGDTRDPTTRSAYAGLRAHGSRVTGAPLVVRPGAGIGFAGAAPFVDAAARAVILQVASLVSPEVVCLDAATGWMRSLPHASPVSEGAHPVFRAAEGRGTPSLQPFVVAAASNAEQLPRELAVVVEFDASGRPRLIRPAASATGEFVEPLTIDLLGIETATAAAVRLAEAARSEGLGRRGGLPEEVSLSDVMGTAAEDATAFAAGPGLACALGIGVNGAISLDLVRDGPHAIVGGTTGSGKSELLLTWVLGMAHARGPDRVTFLFVDFKGGASFAPLVDLPHSVGVITDLDPAESTRAIGSLAAELRFRERALAGAALRSIDDARPGAQPFPRLVVVVDEFATLVDRHQELLAVFTDIAARGRSLGVHLILCTQRPAGVVKDSILANCAVRLSLRVYGAADSVAVVGSDAAARIPAKPPGRAVVSIAGGDAALVQVARSTERDVALVAAAWSGLPRPRSPWLPPLAASIPPSWEAASAAGRSPQATDSLAFCVADRPEEQVQVVVSWRPREHGSLWVTGGAGSGKTGVIAALLRAPTTLRLGLVRPGVAALWDALSGAMAESPEGNESRVLLIDDLDATIAACPQDYQADLTDLLARVLREGPALGIWAVITAQRVGSALHAVAGLCGSTILLRQPSRAEHVAAGGESAQFDPRVPPGGGRWLGSRIQVFDVDPADLPAALPAGGSGTGVDPIAWGEDVAVVSTSPSRVARAIASSRPGVRVTVLTERRPGDDPIASLGRRSDAVGERSILVGDPQVWQGHWSLFAAVLRTHTVVFDGCAISDLRPLTGRRELPPPFDRGQRPVWSLAPGGEFRRAQLSP